MVDAAWAAILPRVFATLLEGGCSIRPKPRELPSSRDWRDEMSRGWPQGSAVASAARRFSPRVLPRGRHRLEEEAVATIQRERIAYATTVAVMQRDGTGVAVWDIVAAARVSREVFCNHFADKEQAFLAVQRSLIFEQVIAAASSAFFVPDTP